MIISTGKSRKDIRWKNVELTWDELLDELQNPKRTQETVEEYAAMDKEAKGKVKDVGGFVGGKLSGERRISGAVTERWLITLDADDAPKKMWSNVTCLHEFSMACYSTHSHTPEKPRLRWVIPLSRPVTPEEYVPIARKLAEWFGIEAMDPSTYQPERLMYWPSVCKDGEYEFQEQGGPLLDPDEVLRSYGPRDAWKDASLWPKAECEGGTVRVPTATKAQDPTAKDGLIGLFCRAYSIPDAIDAFLSDVYEEGDQDRYTYISGTTSNGAVTYEDGKFLYSNHGSDPASCRLCNSFDLVRIHLFGSLDENCAESDGAKLPSFKAMLEFASKDEKVNELMYEELEQDFGPIVSPENGEGVIAVSDKDLARGFMHYSNGEVMYSPALGFLVWDGKRFVLDDAAARVRIIRFIEELQKRIDGSCFALQDENNLSNGVNSDEKYPRGF